MQATSGGGGGAGGGNEQSRGGIGGGLARFRSAPATWLEALLEDDLTAGRDDPLKPSHTNVSLTHLLTATTTTANTGSAASRNSASYIPTANPGFLEADGPHPNLSFHRQNSSPAEFLTGQVDGYLSSFAIPASYEYMGSSEADVSQSGKRFREGDSEHPSPKFAPHLKGEQGVQLSAGASSLLDMDMDMEKLLEDSVPCRVRAKRGCATHPRSIAERVRRTRISDRIRKLQELVPNMDKQTNTADMLDEAVEYVKHLQQQIQELTEHQKKCKCLAKN
ncbi:hypothetical protein Ancab_038175 [Ancistrocladus abbreviatus]